MPASSTARWQSGSWPARVGLVAMAAALYARGFTVGLVGDDYTLLDAALRVPLGELLTGRHGILGYYRPVSRELYFWWWGRVLDFGPTGFHAVNAVTFVAVVALFHTFVRRWLGARTALLAAAAWVLFPPCSALLSWVSCAQDLIALFWGALALVLYQRDRRRASGVAIALAVLSKETAVILPFAIAALEWTAGAPAPPRARLARLLPVFAGLAAAVAIAIAARFTWPAGTSVAVWSPRQMLGAARLPLDFLRTLWPPDTLAGIAAAARSGPGMIALIAGLALLLPGAARAAARPAGPQADPAAPTARGAVMFGLALLVLGMLPVGVIVERWRGYFFSFAALGSSLLIAIALARLPTWTARVAFALAAVVNWGANGYYRPVEAPWAPARHPHVNHEFFRQTAGLSDQMLDALAPWCGPITSMRRNFVVGAPRSTLFDSVLGPGLRITCRDTTARVLPLERFGVADAAASFGVLRFDPGLQRFQHQSADARTRLALGEAFLLFRRYDVAVACLEAARAELPDDPELAYPTALAYLASGRAGRARTAWEGFRARGLTPSAAAFADRLAERAIMGGSAAARETLRRLAAEVLADPADPAPHEALGRYLLEIGNPRQAALELAAVHGATRDPEVLFALATGYESMGAGDEALGAYREVKEGSAAAALRAEAARRIEGMRRRASSDLH